MRKDKKNMHLKFDNMYSHWNWDDSQELEVFTYSNCEEVELILNGKSLGIQKMSDYPKMKMNWIVPYESGEIVAIGRINQEEVEKHTLKSAGKAHHLVLETSRETINADGLDLAYITVKVVDANGLNVPWADHLIEFDVTGQGNIAGVGNGDIFSNEEWQSNQRSAYNGKALLIVRSIDKIGKIMVRAKSDGLQEGRLTIKTTEQ